MSKTKTKLTLFSKLKLLMMVGNKKINSIKVT